MASVTITVSGLSKQYTDLGLTKDSGKLIALNLDSLLWQVAQGAMANASNPNISVSYSASDAVFASGTLTLATASGAVGGTIGGTLKTVTASGGDAATAAALAAAINSDATLSKLVYATSAGAVVTVAAQVPGTVGNKVTLVASGTGVTASGANLANGAGADTAFVFNRTI